MNIIPFTIIIYTAAVLIGLLIAYFAIVILAAIIVTCIAFFTENSTDTLGGYAALATPAANEEELPEYSAREESRRGSCDSDASTICAVRKAATV